MPVGGGTACKSCRVFFLMSRRPPRSTRTDTLFPTRRSSDLCALLALHGDHRGGALRRGRAVPAGAVREVMMTPRKDSLWELIAGPTIWSVYFLVAYVAAAIVCAKGGDMDSLRIAILGLAVAALGAIGFAGFDAWRRWRRGHEAAP